MDSDIQRDAISKIQHYLSEIAKIDADIPRTVISGIYEIATENACKSFQEKHGLPVTGSVDQKTFEKIYEEYLKAQQNLAEPLPLDVFPLTPRDYVLRRGETSMLTNVVQLLLDELSMIYDFGQVFIDGLFGEQTENAVREFQRANMLEETGEIDKETWNRLVLAYKNLTLFKKM